MSSAAQIQAPDPALVQATADLLAARVGLYNQQPEHPLIPIADRCLEALMCPRMVVDLGSHHDDDDLAMAVECDAPPYGEWVQK